VPLNLRAVTTNDLSSLNLPWCAPPPPANLRAGTPTVSSVPVSWDAVTSAAAYRVEVRQGPTGTWTTPSDTITGTSHTVDGLVCQTPYQLRVRARGSGTTYGTAWSAPSASVAVTTATCRRKSALVTIENEAADHQPGQSHILFGPHLAIPDQAAQDHHANNHPCRDADGQRLTRQTQQHRRRKEPD